ncbi:hypothetical protein TorRG33x02_149220 [Trema orientale]|uniref:Uncharacterized protein n=1 Tax=Trema orientale TaxID=63057 RepID=A0A2P5EUN1_TREOI|nr:hypothetical protein TorRG33x02_149220 [Trema orientale]
MHGSREAQEWTRLVSSCSADVGGLQLSASTRLRSRVCCTRLPDGFGLRSTAKIASCTPSSTREIGAL